MSRFLPKSFFRVFALAAVLVGLTSCEKSSGTIGIDFADDSKLSFGSLKEVSIASWTEDFDSLITLMPNALMVGSYDDPSLVGQVSPLVLRLYCARWPLSLAKMPPWIRPL